MKKEHVTTEFIEQRKTIQKRLWQNPEYRKKMQKAHIGKGIGYENGHWKGDKVGYHGLHKWINRKLGRPEKCTSCHSIKKVQWANKSHNYTRNFSDWISLCYWCHRKYDMTTAWGAATKLYGGQL